jgi:CRISPR-associated protein Csm5
MAVPGVAFQGVWTERDFYANPEIVKALGWRQPWSRERLFEAANQFAETLLAAHADFASAAGLSALSTNVEGLRARLSQARERGNACLLNIGWAAGLLAKSAFPDAADENYRRMMARTPYYSRAIKSGMPFPKTRRIVFQKNQPATLPGWVLLEVAD